MYDDVGDGRDDDDDDDTKKPAEGPEETLVKMFEHNMRTVVSVPSKVNKQNADEEDSDLMKIRKNILSQYAQVQCTMNIKTSRTALSR